jgi:hypothetical protein
VRLPISPLSHALAVTHSPNRYCISSLYFRKLKPHEKTESNNCALTNQAYKMHYANLTNKR